MDQKRQHRNLLAQCQRIGSICDPIQASLVPASENTWRNGNSNEPQGHWDMLGMQMVDLLSVTLHIQYLHWQRHHRLDDWGKEEETTTCTVHTRTRRFSSIPCIYNRICQWYDTEKLLFSPRISDDEEQNQCPFRAVDIHIAKTLVNATSWRPFVAATQFTELPKRKIDRKVEVW